MTPLTPAQVCEELGIQDSTLRKYSLLLDKEGIIFERHKNNRRIYTETHVVTLKRTLELMHNDDITLEKAIHQSCNELKVHPVIDDITVAEKPLQRNNSDTTALLIKEIKEMKQQFVEQENRQKERDSMFVEALEELQREIRKLKHQQLVAPELEEEKESNDSTPEDGVVSNNITDSAKKKGFFARLFNK